MRKHVLRTLGVSLLAALGLMAFAVAGAQAELGGSVKVLGSTALATGVTFAGAQLAPGTLKVPDLSIEIVCSDAEFTGHVYDGPGGHALGTVLFLGCVVWSIKKGTLELIEILKECQILASGVTKTVGHITANAYLLVLLHKEDSYLLAEPLQPELKGPVPFTTVEYTKGIGCPLTLKQPITGTTVFKVIKGDLNLGGPEETTIEIENKESIAALFPSNVLKYGISPATVIGKAHATLTGTHKGCKWGVI